MLDRTSSFGLRETEEIMSSSMMYSKAVAGYITPILP
jgi:hypothetical protein